MRRSSSLVLKSRLLSTSSARLQSMSASTSFLSAQLTSKQSWVSHGCRLAIPRSIGPVNSSRWTTPFWELTQPAFNHSWTCFLPSYRLVYHLSDPSLTPLRSSLRRRSQSALPIVWHLPKTSYCARNLTACETRDTSSLRDRATPLRFCLCQRRTASSAWSSTTVR